MPDHLSRIIGSILLLAAGFMIPCAYAELGDRVRIEGLQTIEEGTVKDWLAPQLKFIDSSGVSMAKADDLAYFLETALLDRGYEDAEVDWRVDGEGESGIISLKVIEGRPKGVRQFLISGNEALEDPAVVELLTDTTRKRLGLKPLDSVPYVPSDIEAGRKKLIEFYSLLGHVEAAVELHAEASQAGLSLIHI